MLGHLAIPFGHDRQRALSLARGGALRGGLGCEPQITRHQRQKRARRVADRIKLSLHEAVARVDFAAEH